MVATGAGSIISSWGDDLSTYMYPMSVEIGSGFLTAVVQLLVSAGFAGFVVQLLLIRQNRRKIEGEASTSEANAASTLSGTALKFVEQANSDTIEAKKETAEAKREASEARDETRRYFEAMTRSEWEKQNLRMHVQVLKNALRSAGVTEIPEIPDLPSREAPPYQTPPPPSLP